MPTGSHNDGSALLVIAIWSCGVVQSLRLCAVNFATGTGGSGDEATDTQASPSGTLSSRVIHLALVPEALELIIVAGVQRGDSMDLLWIDYRRVLWQTIVDRERKQ